eukprot:222942_1
MRLQAARATQLLESHTGLTLRGTLSELEADRARGDRDRLGIEKKSLADNVGALVDRLEAMRAELGSKDELIARLGREREELVEQWNRGDPERSREIRRLEQQVEALQLTNDELQGHNDQLVDDCERLGRERDHLYQDADTVAHCVSELSALRSKISESTFEYLFPNQNLDPGQ